MDAIRDELEAEGVAVTVFFLDGKCQPGSRYHDGKIWRAKETESDLIAEYEEPKFEVKELGIYEKRNGERTVIIFISSGELMDKYALDYQDRTYGINGKNPHYSNGDLVKFIKPFDFEKFIKES